MTDEIIVKVVVFNVGNGNSNLIHIRKKKTKEDFIIIFDCYKIDDINPAKEYLAKNNIETIDILIISHFHIDHMYGVEELFSYQIKKIVIPPVFSFNNNVRNNLKEKIKNALRGLVQEGSMPKQTKSFAKFYQYLTEHEDLIEEICGPDSNLTIPGFNINLENSLCKVLLPIAASKGTFGQKILRADLDFLKTNWNEFNDISIVIQLQAFEHNILLTSDSTKKQWKEHIKKAKRDEIDCLNNQIITAMHHGSKHNNTKEIYEYLFTPRSEKYLIVSANGKKHPDDEVFNLINDFQLIPKCTNLSNKCAHIASQTNRINEFDTQMIDFLMNYPVISEPIPCQGNITITLQNDQLKIDSSTKTPCVYANCIFP